MRYRQHLRTALEARHVPRRCRPSLTRPHVYPWRGGGGRRGGLEGGLIKGSLHGHRYGQARSAYPIVGQHVMSQCVSSQRGRR